MIHNDKKNISIKDKPVESSNDDQLKVERYTHALANFILNSDTPITIGLQGEWGTGKTSMMYMLRELLEKENVATSWVNTWEYSMFRGAKETTPAVLFGLLATLKKTFGSAWKGEGEAMLNKFGKVFGNVLNQFVVNQVGIDMRSAAAEIRPEKDLSTRVEIAEIKNDLTRVISQLINDQDNHFQRVVFFIDDLDRINPADAVEVLEALKNIYDINHCIFVLAIDYEVVVKGLEGKFGKKTEENEREFRSFFDKIIQVPFSMPTGAYDIDYYLDKKLEELDLKIPEGYKQLYINVVKHSVGYNPRSLKRFMNTFSLLNTIKNVDLALKEQEEDTSIDSTNLASLNQRVEAMLFAILGIQISYPKIFRYLSINYDFAYWDDSTAAKFDLDWQKITTQIEKYRENSLVDESWEKVVWGLCQSDSYLKSRAFSVLELLNSIKSKFEDETSEILSRALEFAAITSVDDNQESKQNMVRVGVKRIKFASLEDKRQQLKDLKCKDNAIVLWSKIFEPLNKLTNGKNIYMSWAAGVTSFYYTSKEDSKDYQMIYCWNPSPNQTGLKMKIYGPSSDFISDVNTMLKRLNWPFDEGQFKSQNKVQIVNGVLLEGKTSWGGHGRHGTLTIDQDFYKSYTPDTSHAFIVGVINEITKRI